MTTDGETRQLLAEIRDNQRLQIERQLEALTLQREQFAIFQRQAERTDRMQDRAEELQGKSAQILAGARKALVVVVPIIVLLLLYLTWLIFR